MAPSAGATRTSRALRGGSVVGVAARIGFRCAAAQSGLSDGLGERGEIVVIRCRGGKPALVPDQLPSLRRGDSGSVCFTQVPGVWLRHRDQRTHDCHRVGVHIGQRRDGRVLAAWTAATTHGDHAKQGNPPHALVDTDTLNEARLTRATRASGSSALSRRGRVAAPAFRPGEPPAHGRPGQGLDSRYDPFT